MNQILCSTGALIGKPNGRNYRLLEESAAKLDCDGFEFMMFDSWYDEADEVVSYMKGIGLNIPVMHCEKHIGEAISRGADGDLEDALLKFEENCRVAEKIGADRLVIHLWDGMTSDSNFANNLSAYARLHDTAVRYNVDLLIENVVCNQKDPMTHWCELAREYPDIHFIFDTKMAAFHEQLSLIYESEYAWLWDGHIRHLHINDYGGAYKDWANLKTLPIGDGHIDFAEFFHFIKERDYKGDYTVEATAFDRKTGEIDYDILNRCFSTIRQYL